ncbi:MAG TPA: phosphotransferase [Pyrinomonadaceae bacterium]|nr:phosphotransferase [Pyrinomonadaceae bacterium]
MSAGPSIWLTVSAPRRANILEARWQKLCASYLPRAPKDSIWRYDKGSHRLQPSCGWKLHVSATILNAPAVLKRIAPLLIARGTSFKAPRSLIEVGKLNSGLDYRYSQIGKIITVYPRTDDDAVFLAQRLHKLTKRLNGPSVPFDLRFSDSSNVYYRFGAFEYLELARNGRQVPAVYAPDGDLVPDVRELPKPDWVSDPFQACKPQSTSSRQKVSSPIRVINALVQRGKGGVYEAIDLASGRPRLCLLKEGRKNGELSWDGRDGAWRVRNEERVLKHLAACGVPVPRVHSSFEIDGTYYLVMEYLSGITLHEVLLRRHRRLAVAQVLDSGIQLARFMSRMHRAGWAWRDCKPKNIIVTREGNLVPIDFEGAAPIDRPDPLRWGTPGFIAPESKHAGAGSDATRDLYALGSILFLLLTGRVYDPAKPLTIEKLRTNVPSQLRELVGSLLATEPDLRPDTEAALSRLASILRNSTRKQMRLAPRVAA